MCIVVNKYKVNMDDPDIVYIGRGGIWGNPFRIHGNYTRAMAIADYRKHLWGRMKHGLITIEMLKELDGKRLACYCSPLPCHGNIIQRAVQWAKGQ